MESAFIRVPSWQGAARLGRTIGRLVFPFLSRRSWRWNGPVAALPAFHVGTPVQLTPFLSAPPFRRFGEDGAHLLDVDAFGQARPAVARESRNLAPAVPRDAEANDAPVEIDLRGDPRDKHVLI